MESTQQDALNTPALSVIVPCYNAGDDLHRCLDALMASDHDDFEVVVVDDGSTEPIEPIVRRHGCRYLRIEGPGGPARARNRGVADVAGEHVVFIDADVCVHLDTLSRIAARFASDATIAAVVGAYDDAPGHPGFLSQYRNLFHHYVHQLSDGEISTFWSGCGAMLREVFLEAGWFDETRYRRPAIEDIELGTWVSKLGRRIVLDKKVQCKHMKRWTWGGVMTTDLFDRGIPWSRLIMRTGEVPNTLNVKITQRISVAVVYLALLSMGTALWWAWSLVLTAILAVAIAVLNADLYRYLVARRGWWFMFRAIPLHWFYFVYCGVCLVAGIFQHHLRSGWHRTPQAPRV